MLDQLSSTQPFLLTLFCYPFPESGLNPRMIRLTTSWARNRKLPDLCVYLMLRRYVLVKLPPLISCDSKTPTLSQ
jgi:hypothetical protein